MPFPLSLPLSLVIISFLTHTSFHANAIPRYLPHPHPYPTRLDTPAGMSLYNYFTMIT
ncbi:hypothetical protein GALMADRAFT_898531 [Galerina marginata CBS 339.88]|uniref:Uncharacterized protein n=1 Tax=Galerina marginata (strain CBS 339.88) TaxID=685588 RepID=A0A067SGB3_GALM3|nr:hypothetical protein GALMADRAFT_898531 [Galerina marginata CBS 339.88]